MSAQPARDPSAAGLSKAAQRGQFSLVEIMLPRGATSDTLARFVVDTPRSRAPLRNGRLIPNASPSPLTAMASGSFT